MGSDEINLLVNNISNNPVIFFTHVFPESGKSINEIIKLRTDQIKEKNIRFHFPDDLDIIDLEDLMS